jgi:hypothetical protein
MDAMRIDPRIIESLKAEISGCEERANLKPKGSPERAAAELHIAQLKDQFRRINAGLMGSPQ